MSKTTYFFQHRTDRTWVIPITHSRSYDAVQELRNMIGKVDDWMLVKIIETTFCNRSISKIESDYRAMRPRNDRKAKQSTDNRKVATKTEES